MDALRCVSCCEPFENKDVYCQHMSVIRWTACGVCGGGGPVYADNDDGNVAHMSRFAEAHDRLQKKKKNLP